MVARALVVASILVVVARAAKEELIPIKGVSLDPADLAGWTLSQDADKAGDGGVQLTKPNAKSTGHLWMKKSLTQRDWEATIKFTVKGNEEKPGKGLALWFTDSALKKGILMGAAEKYNGFGIIFDSKDDDLKKDNPIIMGWVNDGKKIFNHDTDGLGTRFGGCRAKYRNRGNDVVARIRYVGRSFKMELNMRNNDVWERCMVRDNVDVPPLPFIGMTAQNGPEGKDVVKIISFNMSEVRKVVEPEPREQITFEGNGDIHSLAEKVTNMHMDATDVFLQQIMEMSKRDHSARMQEFRHTKNLVAKVATGGITKNQLEEANKLVEGLSATYKSLRTELDALKSSKAGGAGADYTKAFADINADITSIVQTLNVGREVHEATTERFVDANRVTKALAEGGNGSSDSMLWPGVIFVQVLILAGLAYKSLCAKPTVHRSPRLSPSHSNYGGGGDGYGGGGGSGDLFGSPPSTPYGSNFGDSSFGQRRHGF